MRYFYDKEKKNKIKWNHKKKEGSQGSSIVIVRKISLFLIKNYINNRGIIRYYGFPLIF